MPVSRNALATTPRAACRPIHPTRGGMMDFRFIKQSKAEHITDLDVIELYNCTDGYMPGEYTVATVDTETGEVTLVGAGKLSGYIAVINMGGATSTQPGEQQP